MVLEDTEGRNDVSGKWSAEWPLNSLVDSSIPQWLRDTVLGILFNESGEYPEPDEAAALNQALLHEPECPKSTLPHVPPSEQTVLYCPLPGQVCHMKWWLRKFLADHLDILYMVAEMGNDECTKMQLKFQDSPNPSVFITTPNVGETGLNLTAANQAVITQKFWVLNKQQQAFAWVVQLGQNRVPHT